MKALSLWQPWASAIALGAKRIETRSWATRHRGPIAIHAAKRCVKSELIVSGSWGAALNFRYDDDPLWETLPFGALVAVADLVDCRPTGSFTLDELETPRSRDSFHSTWNERMWGDYSLGRFGWILENIRALQTPIPYRGRQGLFDLDPETATRCLAQLEGGEC